MIPLCGARRSVRELVFRGLGHSRSVATKADRGGPAQEILVVGAGANLTRVDYFPSARQAALAWGRDPGVIQRLCKRGLISHVFTHDVLRGRRRPNRAVAVGSSSGRRSITIAKDDKVTARPDRKRQHPS